MSSRKKPAPKPAAKPKRRAPAKAPTPPAKAVPAHASAYDRHKERQRESQAAASRSGRDIADGMPEVVDPARKARASGDFEFFCRTYFPFTFSLAWSNDHRRALDRIAAAVVAGGQFAYAMPRGSGKTSLAVAGCLWALMTGQRGFVALVGSDEAAAESLLESIKAELECNDLLLADWPEVCYPVRRLEGIAHRCNGQTFDGKRTHMSWTAKEIVLPTVPGSAASAGVVRVAGITGRIRGMQFTRPDGRKVRPSLAIVDDPQTDESAKSPTQSAERERILSGAILGLAGPGQKIAAVMPCTVIAPGDMADRILDRQKHPEWQGERTKLMYAWPRNEPLWEQYRRVREDGLRAGDNGRAATEFYRANREAMDEGAEPAWAVRFNPDELSATQHAMNLRMDLGEAAVAAEYQNEPVDQSAADELLTADEVAAKVGGTPRGRVPAGRDFLTVGVDVQGKLLYWAAVAWSADFTGDVVDYGTFPDQGRSHFAARDARRTLQDRVKGGSLQAAILGGLDALQAELLARAWRRDDGTELRVGRMLVDANWVESTDAVYQFCRTSPHAAVLMPSYGRYVGAASRPWDQYTRRPGQLLGHHWLVGVGKGRAVRFLAFDTNYWKTTVHQRLALPAGAEGGLSLFGREPRDHRLFAEHLTAEYRVRMSANGRAVDEWKEKPGKPDNHWLDCVVAAAAAASMLGCSLLPRRQAVVAAPAAQRPRTRGRVSYL